MSILDKLLKGDFLSVYDETESNGKFHVCRYLDRDDEHVLFQAISTRGYCDGFYCIPTDCIFRIDIKDDYTNRIEKLFRLQNQNELIFSNMNNSSLLINLLSYAKREDLISSIFLPDDESVTGIITDLNEGEGIVCIELLTDDGNVNGYSLIDINSIEKIICDSGLERCIKMLKV